MSEDDDYRPDKFSLSNSEVMATGILCGGAVHNIARELVAMRLALRMACQDGWADGDSAMADYRRQVGLGR